jgi:hypothetical protein
VHNQLLQLNDAPATNGHHDDDDGVTDGAVSGDEQGTTHSAANSAANSHGGSGGANGYDYDGGGSPHRHAGKPVVITTMYMLSHWCCCRLQDCCMCLYKGAFDGA